MIVSFAPRIDLKKKTFYLEMSGGDSVKDNMEKLAIHDDDEIDSSYKPPPEKSIEELLNADKEDASLQKYKEKLLGDANSGKVIYGSYNHSLKLLHFITDF